MYHHKVGKVWSIYHMIPHVCLNSGLGLFLSMTFAIKTCPSSKCTISEEKKGKEQQEDQEHKTQEKEVQER